MTSYTIPTLTYTLQPLYPPPPPPHPAPQHRDNRLRERDITETNARAVR